LSRTEGLVIGWALFAVLVGGIALLIARGRR
jgi:hypothetical protein